MKKAKVILKERRFNDVGLEYISKDKGCYEACFGMAIGYAVELAKENGVSLKEITKIVSNIYKEDCKNED